VVVAVGRIQARRRVTGDGLGQLAAELPDRTGGRLGGHVRLFTTATSICAR
jgi:hypothetical protein